MIQIDTVLLVASLPLELCCLHPLLLLGRVPLHGCCLLPQRWWCSSLITWKQNMIGPVKAWLSTYCLTSLNCFCIHRKSIYNMYIYMYIICTFKLTPRHQTAVAVAAAAVLDTLEETLLDQFMRSNGYLCHVWRPCFLLSLSSSRISGGSHAPNCSALAEIGIVGDSPWFTGWIGLCHGYHGSSTHLACGATPPACCIHCWLIHFCCCSACDQIQHIGMPFPLKAMRFCGLSDSHLPSGYLT